MHDGSGRDTFVFGSSSEATGDQIYDFDDFDIIDLSAIDADTGTSGNQAFTFIGSAAYTSGVAGQLRFDNGVLYGSTDTDAADEFWIVVSGPQLSEGNLVL